MFFLVWKFYLYEIHFWSFIICYDIDIVILVQARTLFKKGGQEVPIELLNNVGVLQFERGEFEVCKLV